MGSMMLCSVNKTEMPRGWKVNHEYLMSNGLLLLQVSAVLTHKLG